MDLSQKQHDAVRQSTAPINVWHGAVRSGKTFSALYRFLGEVAITEKGEFVIACVSTFSFRRNILPLLYQLIGNDVQYSEGKGLLQIWGRRIHVVGAHDARSEGKIRGATFVGAFVDEATLIPEAFWMVLLQRCAMGGARIFATTNPDAPGHWLKKHFIDDNPDCKSFPFSMLDNPALSEQERDYLARQHKGLWHRRFIAGEWCLSEGAIFDFFDPQIHCIKKPPANALYYIVGVDIGFTNPTAFVMIGVNENVSPAMWVEQEYYWDSKKQGRQKTDSEYCDDLIAFCNTRAYIKHIYIDPAAAGFKVEMRRSGGSIPIIDAVNDVLDGIRTVSSFLSNGDLKIMSTCKSLIEEMQSYSWDSKASERGYDEPIKRFDHGVDAMRYAIFSCFGKKTQFKTPDMAKEAIGLSRKTVKYGFDAREFKAPERGTFGSPDGGQVAF